MRKITALFALLLVSLPVQAGLEDSNYQVSEIAYNLRDVSVSGTEVPLGDDQVSTAIPMGFAFPFYGEFYTQAYISSNGFVTFNAGSGSGCCSGDPIPTPGGIDNMVAGFWEDLNPTNGGTIRYQVLGSPPNREFVVGFYQIEHFRGNTPVEMEMILHQNGDIELQYLTATTAGEGNHSVGVESDGGQFGTQVDYGNSFSYNQEGRLLTPDEPGDEEPPARATFAVEKIFSDANPAEVAVTITCNTGLPLEQSTVISEGDGVEFVVRDFEDGELACVILETPVPEGYDAFYSVDGGFSFVDSDGCAFEAVAHGASNECLVYNDLALVLVDVTKVWLDENPQFGGVDYAEAVFDCVNEQYGIQAFGTLEFAGNNAVDGFFLFPHWNGTTRCDVNETLVDSGIEFDDSGCQGLTVTPGNGASCVIWNTRLYEGIPALSQYGLALMAMLMLGIGLLAYRRLG